MKYQETTPEYTMATETTVSLLDSQQVASMLKIPQKAVHKLVREGKLSCVQITARNRRFTTEQIRQYIESQSTVTRVDKKAAPPVSSPSKKGGMKSHGDIGTDLVKEIRSLCR